MTWKSMIPGCEIEDIKADRKTAKSIEQYKVSEKAIYAQLRVRKRNTCV